MKKIISLISAVLLSTLISVSAGARIKNITDYQLVYDTCYDWYWIKDPATGATAGIRYADGAIEWYEGYPEDDGTNSYDDYLSYSWWYEAPYAEVMSSSTDYVEMRCDISSDWEADYYEVKRKTSDSGSWTTLESYDVSSDNITGMINVDDINYYPVSGFTTVDLGCDRGNNAYVGILKNSAPVSQMMLQTFDNLWNDSAKMQDVTDEVIDNITTAYNENSPEFIYFVTIYNIFSDFLNVISEDELPNDGVGLKNSKIWSMLYNFQRDAVLAIISKLEKYNGCILADSVGLGKTFTALAVIKYYEERNKSVLVLCPKKLANNWNTYKDNYVNNPIAADRLRYDVLYHTDLNRTSGSSNGLDLSRLNWSNYDLVVIDESHNFRNGGRISDDEDEKENRYQRLFCLCRTTPPRSTYLSPPTAFPRVRICRTATSLSTTIYTGTLSA